MCIHIGFFIPVNMLKITKFHKDLLKSSFGFEKNRRI